MADNDGAGLLAVANGSEPDRDGAIITANAVDTIAIVSIDGMTVKL